jgi:large subunit ribosomal protein L9
MKVILKQNVPNLGDIGDLKDVAPGYARNHLLPRGLAVEATASKLKEWQQQREKIETENRLQEKIAQSLASKLASQSLIFKMQAGEGGRLFGSVTPADICEQLQAKGFEVDKKKIELNEPIKSIGRFKALVRLHPGVKADFDIIVEKEE